MESIKRFIRNYKCLQELHSKCPTKECYIDAKLRKRFSVENTCWNGHIECLKVLDKYYEVLDLSDTRDHNYIKYAMYQQQYDIFLYLLSRGFTISESNKSHIIRNAPLSIIKILHSQSFFDQSDTMIVGMAICNGRLDTLKFLVEHEYSYAPNSALFALTNSRLNCYNYLVNNTQCIKADNLISYTLMDTESHNGTAILYQNGTPIPKDAYDIICYRNSDNQISYLISIGINPSISEITKIFKSLLNRLWIFDAINRIYETMHTIFKTQSDYEIEFLEVLDTFPQLTQLIHFDKDCKFRNFLIKLDLSLISNLSNITKLAKNFKKLKNYNKTVLYKSTKFNKDIINHIIDNFL